MRREKNFGGAATLTRNDLFLNIVFANFVSQLYLTHFTSDSLNLMGFT
jgi:hypothetical protein